ncbi:FAD-dependent monooxygenase [Paenibacillus sp. N1-5-1-14]|uniref:FAD-dependent oxidoreductase n=1 Tax=Paenibacillus radicibacter TaxID=2972488 RepID=UPI0021594A78|nr:NAD(P)/FAD-dependent oxidoreductase [Paenibacillus radicibacter]MCR8644497.1 FAD-dependent monooxygenase [Paenibacillus radicibacter]
MSPKKVVISGAGLSGLTLGTALAQRGWDVQILERSAELREIGAGLYTWENGLKVLEDIGVYEDIREHVELITKLDMIDEHQELIHSTPFSSNSRFCVIPRNIVYGGLTRAASRAGVQIETSSNVTAACPSGEVTLENGKTYKADLVVGADGIYSNIRNSLNITKTFERVNNGAVRALIPRLEADSVAHAKEHWSGSRRIGISPTSPSHMYVYLTASSSDEEALSDPLNKEAWISSFPHLETLIKRIDQTRLDRHFYYVFMDKWSSGRALVLGDAAHGMEPNLGQGAGVSITSALELAKQLENHDIDNALDRWETLMRPTVQHTQMWSRIYGSAAAHWPKELLGIRNEVIRKALGSEDVDLMLSTAARHITGL